MKLWHSTVESLGIYKMQVRKVRVSKVAKRKIVNSRGMKNTINLIFEYLNKYLNSINSLKSPIRDDIVTFNLYIIILIILVPTTLFKLSHCSMVMKCKQNGKWRVVSVHSPKLRTKTCSLSLIISSSAPCNL